MTKKPSVLILCASNPDNDPRPNRMISWLKDGYQVTVVGGTQSSTDGVEAIGLFDAARIPAVPGVHPGGPRTSGLLYAAQYMSNLLMRRYEDTVWLKLGRGKEILKELSTRQYDLIISHDCTLLPFAFALKQKTGARLLFDAREYYTRDFEEDWVWRLTRKPVFQYLCNTYLKKCDKVLTVSEGLSREYAREYGITPPEVLMSLPYSYDLKPAQTREGDFRIIYHGAANASRQTELMITMMEDLDARFSLDLMMVETSDKAYWRKLEEMVARRKNVRILPPVPMREIVPFINRYDIGLFLCPPANLNLEFVLPNKLFEFIQARLVVAIGPNFEMKRIVDQYGCGIVAEDFEPRTLAIALNELTVDRIMRYKQLSHQAALELNADKNCERVRSLVKEVLS